MIKYLGSKRLLIPHILDVVATVPNVRTVLDLFSGTSRVGHALKATGYRVIANDILNYAHTFGLCYIQAERSKIESDATRLIAEFNAMPGTPGYFTQTFCEQSRFIQPKNGERIDAIRDAIERKSLPPELNAVCLTSLVEAADRVDSTTGLQMAYLKSWSRRSQNDLELRVPDVLDRRWNDPCEAHALDAFDAIARFPADLVYIDPPYNQHAYLGNYHVWESLVLWDKPEVYGIACKRIDCKTRKSPFNRKTQAQDAFARLIASATANHLLVSFSDEGFISRPEIESILGSAGEVTTIEVPHERYVGAKIGIHNPKGDRVGQVGKLTNTEFLFLVDRRAKTCGQGQKRKAAEHTITLGGSVSALP